MSTISKKNSIEFIFPHTSCITFTYGCLEMIMKGLVSADPSMASRYALSSQAPGGAVDGLESDEIIVRIVTDELKDAGTIIEVVKNYPFVSKVSPKIIFQVQRLEYVHTEIGISGIC